MVVRRDELIAAQYFLAVAGVAAMRKILLAPSEVLPRLEDARRVIEHLDEFPQNLRIPIVEYEVVEGYDEWAPLYDAGPNAATELDSEIVRALVEGLPAGRAVDVACGTGRQSLLLTELGHQVEGVDLNETMLAVARDRVPDAHFQQGTFDALPFDDASFDLAVSSLALTHIADLRPALEEMARVVKPGGCAVLSDMHPEMVRLGITAGFRTRRGRHPCDGARAEPPARDQRLRERVRHDRVGDLRVRRSRRCPRRRSSVCPPTRSCPTRCAVPSRVFPSCSHGSCAGVPDRAPGGFAIEHAVLSDDRIFAKYVARAV